MTDYDDEEEKTSARPRFRLMHFTMLMLALLLVSKVSEVMNAAHELVSVREAQAENSNTTDKPPAADADVKKDAAEAGKDAAAANPAPDAAKTDAAKTDAAAPDAKKDDVAKTDDAKKDEKSSGDDKTKPKEEMVQGTGKLSVKEVEALKTKQGASSDYTQSELDLLQNLTKRRNELDEREKEIDLKAKVLDATELRITSKVNEMKALQTDLSKVVAQYKTQQNTEIMSLVKIYENMKPSDAANIFNEMDMPILLEVIDKMSVRKVAPVLAGMTPKKARDVTEELAALRKGRAGLSAAADDATKAPPPAN